MAIDASTESDRNREPIAVLGMGYGLLGGGHYAVTNEPAGVRLLNEDLGDGFAPLINAANLCFAGS